MDGENQKTKKKLYYTTTETVSMSDSLFFLLQIITPRAGLKIGPTFQLPLHSFGVIGKFRFCVSYLCALVGYIGVFLFH